MSVTILFILFLLLLTGKPRFRKHLPTDGSYLSHERTNLINAFFIIIIVLRHIHQRIIPFEGIDLFYAHVYEHKAAQSIVSSFFVFSGYGIMMSLLKKKEIYLKELMSKRFVKLYFNMAVCAFVSAITYIFTYTTWELALHHAVLTCLGLGGYWFIIMTLVIYITTWLSFTRVSQATRLMGSCSSSASRMASEIWSHILSGWPSVTDSEVNRVRIEKILLFSFDTESLSFPQKNAAGLQTSSMNDPFLAPYLPAFITLLELAPCT